MPEKYKSLRILLFGYHLNTERILKYLLSRQDVDIVALVIPFNRTVAQCSNVIEIALNNGINIYRIRDLKSSEFLEKIKSCKPDILLSSSFMQIIPNSILEIPKLGSMNIHPSLLPKYRGPHPLNWVIINGESETGVTLHYMTEVLDAGDIIYQIKIKIDDDETVNSLLIKSVEEELVLVQKLIDTIVSGDPLPRIKQNDLIATNCIYRLPEDGLVSLDWNGDEIMRYVRALESPWPGAYFIFENKKIILEDAKKINYNGNESNGKILRNENSYLDIKIKDGALRIYKVRVNGTVYASSEYFRNVKEISSNDQFSCPCFR